MLFILHFCHFKIYYLIFKTFSLRTLIRALSVSNDQQFDNRRNLYHGCSIAFTTQLNQEQRRRMLSLTAKHFGTAQLQTKLKEKEIKNFVLVSFL